MFNNFYNFLYQQKKSDLLVLGYIQRYLSYTYHDKKYTKKPMNYSTLNFMVKRLDLSYSRWAAYYYAKHKMYNKLIMKNSFCCDDIMEGAIVSLNFGLLSFIRSKSSTHDYNWAIRGGCISTACLLSNNFVLMKSVFSLPHFKYFSTTSNLRGFAISKYLFKNIYESDFIRNAWDMSRTRIKLV